MIKFLILGGLALLVSDVSIPCKMNASQNQLTVALPAPILKTAVFSEAGTATPVWEYPKRYVGWFRIFCDTTSGRYSLTFDPPTGRSSYVVRGLHPEIYFFRAKFFLSPASSSSSPLSNEKRVTVR
jgi:hypothetical protein